MSPGQSPRRRTPLSSLVPAVLFSTAVISIAVISIASLAFAGGLWAASPPPPDPGRLGNTVVPTFEAIELTIDPSGAATSGAVRVELEVREGTDTFRLHADGLSIETLELRGPGGLVAAEHAPAAQGMLAVHTATPLAPGAHVLEMRFSGRLRDDAVGLYRTEVDGRGYAFTQFEVDHARQAFPCWDEPSFKIPYQITVRIPEAHLAVSNTPVEHESVERGTRTVRFARTRPLPSYLLAIATGPLETVPIPGLSVPGRIVTVAGKTALAQEAARTVPALLGALERWFDSPYPFEKLDLIAIPSYLFGAMEHPGAITFLDSILLVDPATLSAEQRRNLAVGIAHELAHMWFGDLVTMAWWDDLWLNEAFASWLSNRVCDELEPQLGLQIASLRNAHRSMGADALLATGAIRRPVSSADVVSSELWLAYGKGQAVLEMVEAFLGREPFRRGVLRYLDAHRWGNARGEDLWNALSAASGRDVGGMLSSFLDQPGVPVVHVETLPGGKVRLAQKRFLLAGASDPKPSLWQIPVILRYSDGADVHERTVLLSEPTAIVDLGTGQPPAWLHPNAGERSYYRWALPAAELDRLAAVAPEQLSARERVGLLLNLGALMWAGELHGDELLRRIGAFASDPDPEVIEVVLSTLGNVKNTFVTPELEPAFAAYVRATLGPCLDRLGWSKTPGEPEEVTHLRPMLFEWLGESGRDPRVRSAVKPLAAAYLKSPESVDPSLSATVLWLAALDGDRTLFETYRQRFETATLPSDRGRFLTALGAFEDPALYQEALAYALSGPLYVQEVPRLLARMNTEARQEQGFRWLTTNFATLQGKLPTQVMVFLPFSVIGCSTQRQSALEQFFADPAHQVPGALRELAKMAEVVERCTSLRQRDGAAVAAYLGEITKDSAPANGVGAVARASADESRLE